MLGFIDEYNEGNLSDEIFGEIFSMLNLSNANDNGIDSPGDNPYESNDFLILLLEIFLNDKFEVS